MACFFNSSFSFPNLMSVPLPAIFVEIVTFPGIPDFSMISASCS